MDELTLVRELGQVPEIDGARLDAARAALLDVAPAAGRRGLVGNRMLAAAAAFVLVGGGSVLAGVELIGSSPSTNTTIECGVDTYVPAESGSPVADCYAVLAASGQPVPPLEGWITPGGMVAVLPKGTAPPTGSTPLPATFQVSPAIRFTTDVLGDQVGPLQTGCLTPAAATAYAASQLELAGLEGWRVAMEPGSGTASCLAYVDVLDAATSTVTLSGGATTPGAGSSNVGSRLDTLLSSQLAGSCASADQGMSLARSDAARLGVASDGLLVSDGGAVGTGPGCAIAFVEPAGFLDVVIWVAPGAGG